MNEIDKSRLNYGNTFESVSEQISAKRIPLWLSKEEMYPNGAYLKWDQTFTYTVGEGSDKETVTIKLTEGTVIPEGTAVQFGNGGKGFGVVALGKACDKPDGLTTAEARVGNNGCSIGVVTRGSILAQRLTAAGRFGENGYNSEFKLTLEQVEYLKSRILFVQESANGAI